MSLLEEYYQAEDIVMFAAPHAQVRVQMPQIFIRVFAESYFLNAAMELLGISARLPFAPVFSRITDDASKIALCSRR